MIALLKPNPKSSFAQDVEDWFLRRRSGHMIRHYYSGKALEYWEAFTRHSKEYYLFDEEAALIQTYAEQIAKKYGQATVVELGTGGIKSGYQKTLPFVKAIMPKLYIGCDWSEESAALVCAIVEKETGIKTDVRLGDFNNKDMQLPTGKKVVCQFGSTLSNIESFPDDPLPFDALVSNLKNYKQNIGDDGALVIGLDQNNNPGSLIASYSHRYHAAFSESILHRIQRELRVSRHFDPANFRYNPIWIEKSYQFVHALVAQCDGGFELDGVPVNYAKGDIFSYDNSFKYPQHILSNALEAAGYSLPQIYRGDRVSLQVVEV